MPSGAGTGAEAAPRFPYYFLSHAYSRGLAPTDEFRRNRLLQRFRENLREAVREYAPGDTGAPLADAVESEIPLGDHWSNQLSLGLARCRSFVALYSNEYFRSEYCGKEWQVFTDRLNTDGIMRGRQTQQAIIPVLWQPVAAEAVPSNARELPAPHLDAGPTYTRYGLNYLLRHMSEHRDEYEVVVSTLARRIVSIAEREPPGYAERLPDYAATRNAFGDAGPDLQRPRINILIAAPCAPDLPRGAGPERYGPRPTDWKPYLPDFDGEIALAARRLAETMGFQVAVEAFEHSAEPRADTSPTAPTLLIIDPWATLIPLLRKRLSGFDARSHTMPWIRPVVAWNRWRPFDAVREPDLKARLENTLARCRRRYRPDSPQVLDGLETIHDFITELPAVIRKAERLYFTHSLRGPAESPRLEEPPPRPRFSGPGPGLGRGGGAIAKDARQTGERDVRPRPPGRDVGTQIQAYPGRRGRRDLPDAEGQP